MKLLLSAFEPFGGESINPTMEIVRLLPSRIGNTEIIKLQLPVVFGSASENVRNAIEYHRPDAVICLGQAGGRSAITPERVAINVDDARIPDNASNQPIDTPIIPNGESAYFSTLPIKAMVDAMQGVGVKAEISNSAGTYVCNHVMYGVLHHISKNSLKCIGGFIHVPFIPQQTMGREGVPSMPLEDMVKGISAAIALLF